MAEQIKKFIIKKCERTETTVNLATKSILVYSVEIRDSDHEFEFQTEINQLETSVLFKLRNSEYQNLLNI